VQAGGLPPMVLSAEEAALITGPDTIDCIAPAASWESFWKEGVEQKRTGAPWLQGTEAAT
jgi:phthalate 4,5-dioxygenase